MAININRHTELGLSDEEVLEMYETMLLARKIDERMWLLNRAGKIPFVISCQGQEAAQVGAAFALDRRKDYVLPYYRDLGVVLSVWDDGKRIYAFRHLPKRKIPILADAKCQVILDRRKTGLSRVLLLLRHRFPML